MLDVTDPLALEDSIGRHAIREVYHLAARLSAVAEQEPQQAWQINVDGLRNVLDGSFP